MALYSFAVRKKGEEKYVSLKEKHTLPFLDHMVAMFTNKRELLYFLSIDSGKYDDIRIKKYGSKTTLPITFATDLIEVSDNMLILPTDYTNLAEEYYVEENISFSDLNQITNVSYILIDWFFRASTAKTFKVRDKVKNLLERVKEKFESISYFEESKEFCFFEMDTIKEEDEATYNLYANEFMALYEEIRGLYMKLIDDGDLYGKNLMKQRKVPQETGRQLLEAMEEKCKCSKMYWGLSANMIALQENIILRNMFINMMAGNEEAFKTYEALDDEIKEKYAPMLAYIKMVRGNAKKLGTID